MKNLDELCEEMTNTVIAWYKMQIRVDYTMHSLYDQVLRSVTSIGANVAESQFSQSPADYKSKMHIAMKEANESRYWVKSLRASGDIDDATGKLLSSDLSSVINILQSIFNK